jgi:hypothetical protein
MFSNSKYKNKNEPFLEPILRKVRFGVALGDLEKITNVTTVILDYGCGPEAKFYSFLQDNKIPFKKYLGYDPLLKNDIVKSNLLISSDFSKFSKNCADVITMFAVLEHDPYPVFDYGPIFSLLKKNGYLLLTTPTKLSKIVLEILAYKFGVVSTREIEEHQHYYDINEIEVLFKKMNFQIVRKRIFEMGMNNYVLLKKNFR